MPLGFVKIVTGETVSCIARLRSKGGSSPRFLQGKEKKFMGKITIIGSSSKGNGFILDDGKKQLIIELGCRFEDYLKVLDYKIESVGGCLVTHRL